VREEEKIGGKLVKEQEKKKKVKLISTMHLK